MHVQNDMVNVKCQVCCSRGRILEQLLANVLSKGHDIVNVNAIFAVSRGRILEQLPLMFSLMCNMTW